MPTSLFYEYSQPMLIERPEGVPAWIPNETLGWTGETPDRSLTFERFRHKVSQSPELIRIAKLASQFGPQGNAVVLRAIQTILEQSQHIDQPHIQLAPLQQVSLPSEHSEVEASSGEVAKQAKRASE